MMPSRKTVLLLASMLVATPALADSWKDESGHSRGEGKEEYWDGNCKIVREWKRNGEYKEEIKCERPPYPRPQRVIYRDIDRDDDDRACRD